jgi:hypothetical protein
MQDTLEPGTDQADEEAEERRLSEMGEKREWWSINGRACYVKSKLIIEIKQVKPRPEIEKPRNLKTAQDAIDWVNRRGRSQRREKS